MTAVQVTPENAAREAVEILRGDELARVDLSPWSIDLHFARGQLQLNTGFEVTDDAGGRRTFAFDDPSSRPVLGALHALLSRPLDSCELHPWSYLTLRFGASQVMVRARGAGENVVAHLRDPHDTVVVL